MYTACLANYITMMEKTVTLYLKLLPFAYRYTCQQQISQNQQEKVERALKFTGLMVEYPWTQNCAALQHCYLASEGKIS